MPKLIWKGGGSVSFPGGPALPGDGAVIQCTDDEIEAIARSPLGAKLAKDGSLSLEPGVDWPPLYEPRKPIPKPAPKAEPTKKPTKKSATKKTAAKK